MQRNEHVQDFVARDLETSVVFLSPRQWLSEAHCLKKSKFHVQILLEGLTVSGLLIVFVLLISKGYSYE